MALTLSRLVEAAQRAIRGQLDTEDLAQAALHQMIQVGTSAGGTAPRPPSPGTPPPAKSAPDNLTWTRALNIGC